MNDLRELYQEVIMDHSRRPRNHGTIEHANRTAHGDNPLCGDKVTVYLDLKGGLVKDIGFDGRGCAISMASASLMTEAVKGRTVEEASRIFEQFHDLVTGEGEVDEEALDKLVVLAGVRDYPVRVKCATLPWHTLTAAINQKEEVISTE